MRISAPALVLFALSLCGCRESVAPPDILLVTLDTTRVDGLGCYGGTHARTPRLDALSRTALRFEQAITPAPYTGPSHASILTGLDPPRHGLRDFLNQAMAQDVPTLPELLRARGYRTAAFLSSYVLDRRFGLDRGFDVYACDFWREAVPPGQAPVIAQGSPSFERRAGATVDEALGWLRRTAGGGAPTFAWVHLFDPHMPYEPPPAYAPRPLAGADETERARRRYFGEIAYVDAQVGRLLDWVSAIRRDERTVVVVAADHGELLGHHGRTLGTHSTHLVEDTLRVPLLVRVPRMRPAAVAEQVRLVDLMPTLLELAGVPAPAGLDGRSLVPALRGERVELPPAYSETFYEKFPAVAAPGEELVSLRRGRFKLVRSPERRELYDLAADPDEIRDVAALHPGVVTSLEAELAALRARPAPASGSPSLQLDQTERQRHLERMRSLGYVR